MKHSAVTPFLLLLTLFWLQPVFGQVQIEPGDPANPTDIPAFYKSKLSDIEHEIQHIKKGKVETVTTSPGGLPVYAVYYGGWNI